MLNLFELFVKVGVDDQASGKLKSIGDKLGNGLKTAAKIGTAAVGAAAAGITALTTAAVNSYAEYEQLVGGVETLFKDSANVVQEYASNAYKTAGLSANEYMSTVTSFSASLLQSLDGDTAAAAEKADLAITDMADNANKMGTSMEMIQNAYQGFAKQNYTMLDNLKLGYGGTKEEMQRLLDHAETLPGALGRDFDISNYADIVDAIHLVQDEMGIAGATALEAGTTIEGSINSMKGAWQNLITGIADENADLSALMDNFITTIVGDGTDTNLGVLGNIMPAVQTALHGIGTLVEEIVPIIAEQLPVLIETLLPSIIASAVSLVTGLVQALPQITKILLDQAPVIINSFSREILTLLPEIVSLGLELIISLANGIAESIPELLPTVVDVIVQTVATLTDPNTLSQLLEAAIAIIMALAEYLLKPDTINQLIDSAVMVIENLVQFLLENLDPLLDAAIEIILALVSYLLEPNNIAKLVETAVQLVVEIAGALVGAVGKLGEAALKLIEELWNKFKETDWGEIGRNILDGIKTGIQNAWNNLKEWFSGLFDDLIGIAKKILGIKSPSRVFRDQIGKQMAAGLMVGWDDEFGSVKKKIEKSLNFKATKIGVTASVGSYGSGNGGSPYGYGVSVVQNIYSEAKTAADLMEEAIYLQKRAVMLGV